MFESTTTQPNRAFTKDSAVSNYHELDIQKIVVQPEKATKRTPQRIMPATFKTTQQRIVLQAIIMMLDMKPTI